MIKSCLPSDGTVPWLRTESKTLKYIYAVSINMINERSHRECRNLKMVRGMAIADFIPTTTVTQKLEWLSE